MCDIIIANIASIAAIIAPIMRYLSSICRSIYVL